MASSKIEVDKKHIKNEISNLKIKSLLVERQFTDIEQQLWKFLEIADALDTFQKEERREIKDVIKLIKKYHVSQLSGMELTKNQLLLILNKSEEPKEEPKVDTN